MLPPAAVAFCAAPSERGTPMASDETDRPDLSGFDWRAFTPEDSPKGLPDVFAEQGHLASADLAPGDPAFDFELPVFDHSDGTSKATGRTFHLAALAATRPVALVFGSYT
ncbi:MAG: hypothetical protein OEV20_03035 [Actinomycetota bacterium]|nr:hypothetical protein [Actinomycetota bacterium]